MPLQAPPQPISADKEFQQLLSDPVVRAQLRKTLKGFGLVYFPHHLYLPPGEHHDPMLAAMEHGDIEFLEVIGFRGCSKTTWGSLIRARAGFVRGHMAMAHLPRGSVRLT